jgi:hypothetical protein
MRQYSIDGVELAWLGLDFKEGLAAGTSITEARTSPSWTIKATGQGRAVRVYNPDRTGTVSVVVDQESQLHQSLLDISRADRNPATRDQVGAMVLNDTSSGEKVTWANSFITTDPDLTRATESATFTWVFGFESVDKETVDPLTNLVGS